MKRFRTLIYICIVISLINIFTVITRSQQRIPPGVSMAYSSEQAAFPVGCDVIMPEKINLAGEEVPLHRLDVSEALRKELIVNSYLHSHTIQILKNAPRVFHIIEPILKMNSVPDDMKYIAVIESMLNSLAVSPAGAVGLWQFMKNTGEEWKLEVNSEIDERYNIEKATQAAANYLKKAYDRFGSWTTAAASYNAGAAMISRQMDIQKEKNYYSLLLGEETDRYVFRILAMKQILNNPELYRFKVDQIYPTEKTRKIKVEGPVKDWADFAIEQGISYKTLKRFNPWLRTSSLRNPHSKTYEISVPEHPELYR